MHAVAERLSADPDPAARAAIEVLALAMWQGACTDALSGELASPIPAALCEALLSTLVAVARTSARAADMLLEVRVTFPCGDKKNCLINNIRWNYYIF